MGCSEKEKRPLVGGGMSKKDADSGDWVYLPNGTCEKLAGGSLEAKK